MSEPFRTSQRTASWNGYAVNYILLYRHRNSESVPGTADVISMDWRTIRFLSALTIVAVVFA